MKPGEIENWGYEILGTLENGCSGEQWERLLKIIEKIGKGEVVLAPHLAQEKE